VIRPLGNRSRLDVIRVTDRQTDRQTLNCHCTFHALHGNVRWHMYTVHT